MNWKSEYTQLRLTADYYCQSHADEIISRFKPVHLYRYRKGLYNASTNINFDIDNLIISSIKLSSPLNFNDPYDCTFCVNFEEFYKKYAKLKPNIFFKNKSKQKSSICLDDLKNILNHIRETTFIGCFTETYNSILMWSHYANNHQGFCIAYDFKDLNTLIPLPVIYTNKMPNLVELNAMNDYDGMKECFLIKSIEWKYEKEWRLIRSSNSPAKFLDINMPTPSAIYLGCRAITKLQTNLMSLCEEKNIPLYKMHLKENKFELIAKPI